jgi:hypothetical protein
MLMLEFRNVSTRVQVWQSGGRKEAEILSRTHVENGAAPVTLQA